MGTPSPTPAPLAMTAVALDDRVDLDAVLPAIPWPVRDRDPHGLALAPPPGGCLYLFSLGALVFEREGDAAPPQMLLEEIARATGRTLLPDTTETYGIRIDPGLTIAGGRVGWDQIAVAERTPDRMAAIALLLGQSAALERYERGADRVLEEAMAVAHALASRGRPPQRSRRQVRRLGRILQDRLALARWFYLADRPEETWEKPEIAALYDALFQNLELKGRHEAMLHKLQAAETGLETSVNLFSGVWGLRLEWAIVLLIVVEIVLAVGGWF